MMRHCEATAAERLQARLGRISEALISGTVERIEEAGAELERAVDDARMAADADPMRLDVIALRRDLALVTALWNNASQFHAGWARISAGSAAAYTSAGASP